MAPTTRLNKQPDRRKDYKPNRKAPPGNSRNPIVIADSPPPQPQLSQHPAAVSKQDGRVTKKTTKKKPKPVFDRKECSICVESKTIARGFKKPDDVEVCAHFESICKACIWKMVKTMIAERQLADGILKCPFGDCDHALDFSHVKQMVSGAQIESWDEALKMHHLRSSQDFIACLNLDCGLYFSVEDCRTPDESRTKKKVKCPYCDHSLCLTCNRPWHSRSDCAENQDKENKQSEKAIKKMGAKPCPKCGVNIEKNGGCDHMFCQRCGHNFCFQCLVQYTADMRHNEGCPHGVQNIANDPRNWVGDGNWNINMFAELRIAAQNAAPPAQNAAPPANDAVPPNNAVPPVNNAARPANLVIVNRPNGAAQHNGGGLEAVIGWFQRA